ncbi:MAG TPA: recombinase family protein [Pseudobacteroides sp.]|uniref:recombinase family protein n=1 Tax=Pseudobacteroides sp. TaxID=1968840 RepID=UPI002F9281AF
MRVACYCRVSTKKKEQLESLENQIKFFNDLVNSHPNYELFHIYYDEGISGKAMTKRDDFLRMMDEARKGSFEAILVKDITRFSRNTVDFLVSIRELKLRGINVIFVSYGQETLKEETELNLTMQIAFAQEESARLSRKVKFGKALAAKDGIVPNFVFGFDRIDKHTLVPNQIEVGVVQKIFDLYVNESWGTARIAGHLNDCNIRTKKNKKNKWSQVVITQILRNAVYIGKIVNHKSEVADYITGKRKRYSNEEYITVEKPEIRIISDELFYRAQEILESRKESFNLMNKRDSVKYPLSNLIKCSECGYSFRRCQRKYSAEGKTYKWWTCSIRNARGVNACINNIVVDEDELHNALLQFLNQFLINKPKTIKAISKEIKNLIIQHNKNTIAEKDNKQIQAEITRLNKEIEKNKEMYKKDIIGIDELKYEVSTLTEKLNQLKLAQGTSRTMFKLSVDIDSLVTSYMSKVEHICLSEALDNSFLKQIIERITVYPDGVLKIVLKVDNKNNLNVEVPLEIYEIPLDDIVPMTNDGTQRCYRTTCSGKS